MDTPFIRPGAARAQEPSTLAVFTVALTVLADWLFFGQPLGWTVGAFSAALLAVVLFQRTDEPQTRTSLLLALLIAGLCLRCVYKPNGTSATLVTLGLVALALVRREGGSSDVWVWLERGFDFTVLGLFGMAARIAMIPIAGLMALFAKRRFRSLHLWVLPLALGVVFLGLFAVANPVISQTLADLWRHLTTFSIPHPSLLRVVFWFACATAIGALLWHVTNVHDAAEPIAAAEDNPVFALLLPPAVVRRALIVFNVLFALQTLLDLRYLWGGATLPEGLTYARYAHRGAYVLIVAALLAGLFALAAFRPGVDRTALRLERKLVYLWLAQTLFLVVSSVWRLWLYVGAYSLTRLRVAAGVWMLMVALGLLWIAARIVRDRSDRWLLNANAITTLVVLYLCAWTGADAHIARFNVRHCAEVLGPGHPDADVEYLVELGPDALPALRWLSERCPDHEHAAEWQTARSELSDILRHRLSNWRGWTLQRAGLRAEMVEARQDELLPRSYVPVRPEPDRPVSEPALPTLSVSLDAPAAEPAAVSPEAAEPMPVVAAFPTATGTVVALRSGRLTVRQPAEVAGTFVDQNYAVARRAQLRGIASLAELRANQPITFRILPSAARPTIIELAVPGSELTGEP